MIFARKPDQIVKKKKKLWQKILIGILCVLLVAVLVVAAVLVRLTITEYKPQQTETVAVGTATIEGSKALTSPEIGRDYSLMTWNIGYGALQDTADFFMDGGKMVNTASEAEVISNLESIGATVEKIGADIRFIQEIDRDSARSHGIDEVNVLLTYAETSQKFSFAHNFKVEFIPYPIPPIGKVESGILTETIFDLTESERISLPTSFSWPVRMANLKRCLLISRVPVQDAEGEETGKELVLVNLHLEAFDDGAGKIAQTLALRSLMEQEVEAGNYVIAGGDFNQTFSNTDISAYPLYEGTWHPGSIAALEFSDGWQFFQDNRVPSGRSLDRPFKDADPDTFQYYVIDGFIVSDNIEVKSVETVDLQFAVSDHNPVVMHFKLN